MLRRELSDKIAIMQEALHKQFAGSYTSHILTHPRKHWCLCGSCERLCVCVCVSNLRNNCASSVKIRSRKNNNEATAVYTGGGSCSSPPFSVLPAVSASLVGRRHRGRGRGEEGGRRVRRGCTGLIRLILQFIRQFWTSTEHFWQLRWCRNLARMAGWLNYWIFNVFRKKRC